MKNFIVLIILAQFSTHLVSAQMQPLQERLNISDYQSIPDQFLTSSHTSSVEWGCPVLNETVNASSKAEAMGKIEGQCLEQVRMAARGKKNVLDVISVKTVWPDVEVTESEKGYVVNGTFFLEAMVFIQKREGK